MYSSEARLHLSCEIVVSVEIINMDNVRYLQLYRMLFSIVKQRENFIVTRRRRARRRVFPETTRVTVSHPA
jgi:hypothetical protein